MAYRYQGDDELERSTDRVMAVGAFLLVGLALAFPLYRWVEPGNREDARTEQAADLAAEGKTVWEFSCASCHAADGEGDVGPALNSKQFLSNATDAQATLLVSVGVPGTKMSAFALDHGGPLTSEQIKSVVAYMRSWEPDAPDRPDWRDMVGG